jgi:hypothetical protein
MKYFIFVYISIPAKTSFESFLTSYTTSKLRFYFSFNNITSKVWPRRHPSAPLPLPLGFTAISDHPRGGEVLTGCGPQSGTAPVRIPISFRSRAMQSARSKQFLTGIPDHRSIRLKV